MKHSWIKYLDSGHAGDNNGVSVPGHVDVKLNMELNLKTSHTVTFVLSQNVKLCDSSSSAFDVVLS